MKIIITGGCGFIGSEIIRTLMTSGKHTIINIDKLTYASNQKSLEEFINKKKYFFEKIDILNKSKIDKIFQKYKPDGIIHLAAESHVDRSIEASSQFMKTNIFGTYNLLECTRKYLSKVNKKFVFLNFSTDEVYGDLDKTNIGFTEKSPYKPSSPYSASKASADHIVRAWQRTYKLPSIIINCSNNYGPFQFPEKFIPHVILNAIFGEKIPIYGKGTQIRDWIYVKDTALAVKKIFFKGKIGETYNVGTGIQTTNIKLAKLICKILNEKIKIKPKNISDFKKLINHVQDRPGHDVKYLINSKKIISELGWRPKTNLEKGLIETVNWYLQNKRWWKDMLNKKYDLKRLGKIEKI